MPTLYLVRHARPTSAWGEHPDPALDAIGTTQAETTAWALGERIDPLPIYTSPLLRCRETAAPLMHRWGATAATLAAVAEIPSPPLVAAAKRDWLNTALRSSWSQVQQSAPPGAPDYRAWRIHMFGVLAQLPGDSVIFTHFIAINAIVGHAQRNDAVVCFRPDYASVTVVRAADADSFRVIDLGREAVTGVLTGA